MSRASVMPGAAACRRAKESSVLLARAMFLVVKSVCSWACLGYEKMAM